MLQAADRWKLLEYFGRFSKNLNPPKREGGKITKTRVDFVAGHIQAISSSISSRYIDASRPLFRRTEEGPEAHQVSCHKLCSPSAVCRALARTDIRWQPNELPGAVARLACCWCVCVNTLGLLVSISYPRPIRSSGAPRHLQPPEVEVKKLDGADRRWMLTALAEVRVERTLTADARLPRARHAATRRE